MQNVKVNYSRFYSSWEFPDDISLLRLYCTNFCSRVNDNFDRAIVEIAHVEIDMMGEIDNIIFVPLNIVNPKRPRPIKHRLDLCILRDKHLN